MSDDVRCGEFKGQIYSQVKREFFLALCVVLWKTNYIP